MCADDDTSGDCMLELHVIARADLADLPRVAAAGRAFLADAPIDDTARYVAELAIEEAVSNVMRHGGLDPGASCIDVRLVLGDGGIDLHVADPGVAFDPLAAPEPDLDVPLEDRRSGGLGLVLLRRMTAGLHYERRDGRNHLRVRIDPASSAGSGAEPA